MDERSQRGSPLEVLLVFLKLGVTCFGGPIAHIGYFREAFVVDRRWLDEHSYAELVALCQFLPGPASSQVGFAIGLMRAGYCGALATWRGFTLPSAAAMVFFAYAAGAFGGKQATACFTASSSLQYSGTGRRRHGAYTLSGPQEGLHCCGGNYDYPVECLTFGTDSVALGGCLGLWLFRDEPPSTSSRHIAVPISRSTGIAAIGTFLLMLAVLPLLSRFGQGIALFEAFYRSGALVFGGGHVVLPLLRQAFVAPGWVSDDSFLAGYAAAQAVPGPLFRVCP